MSVDNKHLSRFRYASVESVGWVEAQPIPTDDRAKRVMVGIASPGPPYRMHTNLSPRVIPAKAAPAAAEPGPCSEYRACFAKVPDTPCGRSGMTPIGDAPHEQGEGAGALRPKGSATAPSNQAEGNAPARLSALDTLWPSTPSSHFAVSIIRPRSMPVS